MAAAHGSDVPAHILSSIYQAASAPSGWSDAVAGITAWTGGTAGSLQARRLGERPETMLISSGLSADQHHAYVSHHFKADPHLVHLAHLPVGRALVSREVLSHHALQRTPYYNDFCRPQSLRDLQGVILVKNAHWAVALAIFGAEDETFTPQTRARLNAIAPHVTRALELGFRFDGSQASAPDLQVAAQMRLVGWARVDSALQLVEALDQNSEHMLHLTHSPLRVERRKLRTLDPDQQLRLESAVKGAIAGQASTFTLGRGASGMCVGVAPGPRLWPLDEERCASVVFGQLQANTKRTFEELPISLRGVAEGLAQGLSDKEIASGLGLSSATARTYVSRVLKRLHLHDRRELIRPA